MRTQQPLTGTLVSQCYSTPSGVMTSKQHDFSIMFHCLEIGGIFTQIRIVSLRHMTNVLVSIGIETMPMDSKIFWPSFEILVLVEIVGMHRIW